MKSRLLAIGLLSLVLISGKSFAQYRDQVSAPELQGFDRYVLKAMQDWNIPGLAIAVVKDDKVVHARGYGVRELGKPGRVNKDTLFAIASNSKAFTATAIGMLVHDKKISWDDPVIKHMPTLQLYDPYINRELTVRDLLCHRAGYGTWDGDLVALGSNYSREEIIHRLRYLKPIYSLRSRFGYSNLMFLVAGQIIPQVTDTTWDDFLNVRIFTPLGMSRTNTSIRDLDLLDNVATPHTLVDEKIVTIPYMNVDNGAPAGAINSSALDMTRWLRMQLADGTFENSTIVDSSIIDEMRKPHTVGPSPKLQKDVPARTKLFRSYGLGWGLADYSGRLMVSHGGGLPGMLSRVAMIPEENLGVVVLTNYDDQRLHGALVNRVFDAYLGIPAFDWSGDALAKAEKSRARKKQEKEKRIAERDANRQAGSKSSREPRYYAGNFTNDLYGQSYITEQDEKLVLKLSAHPDNFCELDHWHYDTFLCRWHDSTWGESLIPFTLDQNGNVISFSLVVRPDWFDPHVYIFTRVDDKGDSLEANKSAQIQNRDVTAGCAMCIFKMKGVIDCVMAVEIEGKHYLVKGNRSGIDDHGDAHADDGLCNTSRKAVATGEIKNGVFVSKKIELLPDRKTWFFSMDAGKAPADWNFGYTNPADGQARWNVVQDAAAPSAPYVLKLESHSGNRTFNIAVVESDSYDNVSVQTLIRADAGSVDQGGGLVWRYRDENNYYICRINPLENNFRVYKVANGKRTQLETANLSTKPGKWYLVRAVMVGDRIACYVDGKKYLEANDNTFTQAGLIGLWTKADASSSFDDVAVQPMR